MTIGWAPAVAQRYSWRVKISLERLDARALDVELPGTRGERVMVRAAEGLRGVLAQDAGALTLSDITAETFAVDTVRLVLGELVLSSATGITFGGVGLTLEQREGQLAFDVTASSALALDLTVEVDGFRLSGRMQLEGFCLSVRNGDGSLEAERVELSGFAMRIDGTDIAAESVSGSAVAIGWGSKGFTLTAAAMGGPAVRITAADLRLAGTDVAMRAFALGPGRIEVGGVTVAGGQLALTFASRDEAVKPVEKRAATEAPPALSRAALAEWHALDLLSGEVDVDVELDLSVPILGSRNATHRLRVPIERGSLDFRALENNLSTLENALLDFSVRDGALVLERINPLFPARGHGKPVVVWDLDPTDLAIAETNRVRLAVLPHARVVGSNDDDRAPKSEGEGKEPRAIALRRLGLHRINVRLALAPIDGPLVGQVRPRRVDSLVLQGSVFHHPGHPPPAARLLGEVAGASVALVGLRLGTTTLDASSVTFGSLAPIEVGFLDVNPTNALVDMAQVAFEGVVVTLG